MSIVDKGIGADEPAALGDFSPLAMYRVARTQGDSGDFEALTEVVDPGAPLVATHVRNAAICLAIGTEALEDALSAEHPLLTANDVNDLVEALGRQLMAISGAAANIAAWLKKARQRGEIGPSTAADDRLSMAAQTLPEFAARISTATVADDNPVPLHSWTAYADAVTAAVRRREVTISEPEFHNDDLVVWDLLSGELVLQVNSLGWMLVRKEPDPSEKWDDAVTMPRWPFAHPEQIAALVKQYLDDPSTAVRLS